eukprot:1031035-Rhodomonas_salina.2
MGCTARALWARHVVENRRRIEERSVESAAFNARALHLQVLDAIFHPTQPWLFTCGVDQTVRMFTER